MPGTPPPIIPQRKYPHTLEFVDSGVGIVSVNTGRANALVREAIESGVIAQLADPLELRPEAKIPDASGRFDFAVRHDSGVAWVEVKSTTLLVEGKTGAFPDAVSERALKHVLALQQRVAEGDRGVLIFCAQHCGIRSVRPAAEVDPRYADGLLAARDAGG